MFPYKQVRCTECDAMLWSNHAKAICLCPDCEVVDSDILQDLEERLEEVLK